MHVFINCEHIKKQQVWASPKLKSIHKTISKEKQLKQNTFPKRYIKIYKKNLCKDS